MDVSAHDVRNARFSGTRHVYDRREVDAFLERLGESLARYEKELMVSRRRLESLEHALEVANTAAAFSPRPAAGEEDLARRAEDLRVDALAEAARIRRAAEEEARRISAEARSLAETRVAETGVAETGVAGADVSTRRVGDSALWRDGLEAELAAEAFIAGAREDARRMLQIAEQQVAEGVEEADRDRAAALDELEREVTSVKDAAGREASRLVAEAKVEGDRVVEEARRAALQMTDSAQREVRSMERRVRQIRSSLRDLERRFTSLTANTLAEFSMLGDFLDLETRESMPEPLQASAEPAGDEATESRGFYERRLAGLRSRLAAHKDEPTQS